MTNKQPSVQKMLRDMPEDHNFEVGKDYLTVTGSIARIHSRQQNGWVISNQDGMLVEHDEHGKTFNPKRCLTMQIFVRPK